MKKFMQYSSADIGGNVDVYEMTHIDRLFIRNEIQIPGFGNYQVLKCDFHTHTVFSDGLVWPDTRVYEAWQDGLDAVAITDHIEHRPNARWLNADFNEAFRIAKKAADDMDFLVIPGAEITRSKPLGHLNTLFVEDVNPLKYQDPLESIREAKKQGAFISWNHPGWPDNQVALPPLHERLLQEGGIDGIEVMSYKDFYPLAFHWCARYKKAFMAATDAHCPIRAMYGNPLRPMTLCFAEERSLRGIRDALFNGRTAAWFDGKVAGMQDYLEPLVKVCIRLRPMSNGCLQATNVSDLPFSIFNRGKLSLLPGRKTIIMESSPDEEWVFDNCFIDADRRLTMRYKDMIHSQYW